MQTEKLAFFETLGSALGSAAGFKQQKRPLTSIATYSKLFKIGIYKRLGNEFKNLWPLLKTTGMHFATTALLSMTCGLIWFVPAAPYLVHRSVKLLVSIWLEDA